MLPTAVLGASVGIGLAAGCLIGAVGVGGIIVVPSLIEFASIDEERGVKGAIAAAMFSYIFVGIAGGYAYYRKSEFVVWSSAIWLMIGATPGAFAGAFSLEYIPGDTIKYILYGLILVSSVFALYRTCSEKKKGDDAGADVDNDGAGSSDTQAVLIVNSAESSDSDLAAGEDAAWREDLDLRTQSYSAAMDGTKAKRAAATAAAVAAASAASAAAAVMVSNALDDGSGADFDGEIKPWMTWRGRAARLVIGCFTGFASALTGTSGPVVLLPILFIFGWQVHDAAGSAQMIQFPIAVAATIATQVLSSETPPVDYALGGCIAAGIVPGAFAGAAVAFSLPAKTLKLVISIVLVSAAVFLIGKLIYQTVDSNDDGNHTNHTHNVSSMNVYE